MKTKIVVDSSSNLYTLSGVDFACVPLKIAVSYTHLTLPTKLEV